MNGEALWGFFYTVVHMAPFNGLVFFAFRHRLRWSWFSTLLGYLFLLVVEGAVQARLPGIYDQRAALLFQVLAAAYTLWAVRAYRGKVLALGLLTVPLALLSFSAAHLAGQCWPLPQPETTEAAVLVLLFLLFLGPAVYYIRQVIEPLLEIQEKKPWLYLAGYETMLIFIALLIDPFHESVAPRVFVSRVLLLSAVLACVQVMAYLCRSIRSREYTRHLLNSVQALQEMERQRYETVMQHWRSSRRLRHDLQHCLVSIAALARAKKGAELKAYLRDLLKDAGVHL